MIVKKVANPHKSSTKQTRIRALLEYIYAPERDDTTEKCVHAGARGFLTDTVPAQITEMSLLAEQAARSRDPILHYVLSWRPGEEPTPLQIERAVQIFMRELAITEHQVAYALHKDTNNAHLHVVVNRVHPGTGRPVQINRGFDVDAAQRAGALIEHQQGWQVEANKRWKVTDDGRAVATNPEPPSPDRPNRPNRPKQKEQRQPSQRQHDMTHRGGVPSVTQRAIDTLAPLIKAAQSWRELHAALAPHDAHYHRKGGGAAIAYRGELIKASAVGRHASLRALERSFGAPYEARDPGKIPPLHPLRAWPLIAAAATWADLHKALHPYGLRYERARSGARIRSVENADHDVTASRVHRHASLKHLKHEDKLGPYQPPAEERAPGRPEPELTDPADAAPIIAGANSWRELHERLADAGMRYERKGSGAVIHTGTVTVKASSVSRKATPGALERRYGAPYEPPPERARQPGTTTTATPETTVVADPDLQADNIETDEAAEREHYRRATAAARIAYQQDYKRKLAKLKAEQAKEREDALAGDWTGNGHALNALRHALRIIHDAQKAELELERRKAEREHRRRYPPWPDIKPGLQNSWVIPGAPAGRPEPVAGIHAYTARIAPIGVAYAHRDRQGRPDFLDTGPEIRFLRRPSDDPEAMRAAVQLIVAKGTRRIRIHAKDREFIRLAIASLVEHGIAVTNPELREQVIAEQLRQARAAAELQPPTAAPSTPDPAVATPEAAPVAYLPPVKMVLVPADGPGIFRHDYDARPPAPAVPLAGYRAERQSDTGSVSYIRDGSDDVVAVDSGGALLLTSACRDQDVLRAVLGLADARFTAGIACSKSPAPTVMGDEHAKWVEAIQYWSARDKRHLVDPEPPQLATSFPRLHRPPKTQLAETPVARTRPRGAERD